MRIRANDLMKMYLLDFELEEFVEHGANSDFDTIKGQLPDKLRELLDLPILLDIDGNYLINNPGNKKWVEGESKLDNYERFLDHTGFETSRNEVNLWKYCPDIEKYFGDHLLWAESFLKFGIFFSILLYHKLKEINDKEFKVIFSFGLSKLIDGVVRFHSLRSGEFYVPEDFEKSSFVQGIFMIEN